MFLAVASLGVLIGERVPDRIRHHQGRVLPAARMEARAAEAESRSLLNKRLLPVLPQNEINQSYVLVFIPLIMIDWHDPLLVIFVRTATCGFGWLVLRIL